VTETVTRPEAGPDPDTGHPTGDGATAPGGWRSRGRRLRARLRGLPVVAPRSRRGALATAVVLVLVLLAGAGQLVYSAVTALPAGAALRVGGVHGEVVTTQALDARVRLYGALYGIAPPADPAGQDTFRRDTAKAVAVSEVVSREAADRNIVVADKAVSDQLDQLVARSFPAGRDDFLARLSGAGISEKDVLDEVRRQMVTARLYDQITHGVPPVSDGDVASAYDQRRATLTTPEQRHVRAVVLGSQPDAGATLDRLRGGADFTGEAARSLDQSTRGSGGDLGLLGHDQVASLDQGLADAVFAAAPGAFVGPLPLQQAWVVAQVTDVRPGTPLTLDQARDGLRAQLGVERTGAVWNGWITDRLRADDVEYADDHRPADPLSAPAPR
jgi:parvulin-like peptidyl-prolyl isomerase